jgi:hypothetical protein
LEAEDVAFLDAYVLEALVVEQLFSGGAVVELVAEGLAVGGVDGETELVEQDDQQPIDRRVVGHLDILTLVSCGVPDLNRDQAHMWMIPC